MASHPCHTHASRAVKLRAHVMPMAQTRPRLTSRPWLSQRPAAPGRPTRARAHTHISRCLPLPSPYANAHLHTNTYIYTHERMHACTYIRMHARSHEGTRAQESAHIASFACLCRPPRLRSRLLRPYQACSTAQMWSPCSRSGLTCPLRRTRQRSYHAPTWSGGRRSATECECVCV